MAVDLHIHTTASDGWLSPEQVLQKAREAAMAGMAVTDHDTVDGVLQLARRGCLADMDPLVVPGIELSTDLPENEVHILGYGLNMDESFLRAYLDELIQDRRGRVEKMVKKLNQLGYPVECGRVKEIAGDAKALGRPHVAQALLEKGYFASIGEVFDKMLAKNGPAYVPHYKLLPEEIIRLIHRAGGAAVLAHPGQIRSDQIVMELLELGLDGLEVYHPHHSEEETQRYRQWALEKGLLITGGSDFHGMPGRFPEQLGIFMVEEELLVDLQRFLLSVRR